MGDAADLKGLWQGSYSYSSSAEIGETQFKARLGGKDGALTGLMTESHLHKEGQIKAQIEGVFERGIIRFTKQYVEAGTEYSRPVQYEGALSADGQSISGTWVLPDDSGTFVMHRST